MLWVRAALFTMFLDLVAFITVKILMLWLFPKPVFGVGLLLFTIGVVVFSIYCGDSVAEDGTSVLLSCDASRF